jgi:hypothetical protein
MNLFTGKILDAKSAKESEKRERNPCLRHWSKEPGELRGFRDLLRAIRVQPLKKVAQGSLTMRNPWLGAQAYCLPVAFALYYSHH